MVAEAQHRSASSRSQALAAHAAQQRRIRPINRHQTVASCAKVGWVALRAIRLAHRLNSKLIHPIRPVGHLAAGLDFIVVQVPTKSPFSNCSSLSRKQWAILRQIHTTSSSPHLLWSIRIMTSFSEGGKMTMRTTTALCTGASKSRRQHQPLLLPERRDLHRYNRLPDRP
jgi:hypothetical protein